MQIPQFRPWFQDQLNALSARRLQAKHPLPTTLARLYWAASEYLKDQPRLARLGYSVVSETQTPSSVSATIPADTGGVMGHLNRTVTRPLPSIHVLYHRPGA